MPQQIRALRSAGGRPTRALLANASAVPPRRRMSPMPGRRRRRPVLRAWWSGAATAFAGRWFLQRVVLTKARRDVTELNAGNHRPLLSGYADDAVLRFHEGDHRWSGDHRGRPAIERFLRSFVAAGLHGEVREAWMIGPPWRTTIVLRFDDHALGERGEVIYRNRTVLVLRARWGRIVHHEDFYEDTERILRLEEALRQIGK